jgi:LPXTG-motif cell wall-anchored protein
VPDAVVPAVDDETAGSTFSWLYVLGGLALIAALSVLIRRRKN